MKTTLTARDKKYARACEKLRRTWERGEIKTREYTKRCILLERDFVASNQRDPKQPK